MNRRHQILLDFLRLLNDKRVGTANIAYGDDVVTFDAVLPTPSKSKTSTGEEAGYMCMEYPVIAKVTLERDYSNMFEEVAAVRRAIPFKTDKPLVRFRVSTMGDKQRNTLSVTAHGNYEFFHARNTKCSDELAALLSEALQTGKGITALESYWGAFVSSRAAEVEHHFHLADNEVYKND